MMSRHAQALALIAATPTTYDVGTVTISSATCSEADALMARYRNDDPEAAAKYREERKRRKAEAYAKRQPKRRPCSTCNGWGFTQGVTPSGIPHDPVECDRCDGEGTTP